MRRAFAPIGSISEIDAARFWNRVRTAGPDDCWPFIGANVEGYGIFVIAGGNRRANRIAWALHNRQEPDGIVCHSCDNPSCCNPAHLWIGDDQSNQNDCSAKGRQRAQAETHCAKGHEFSPENTYWRLGKIASRQCRACNRAAVQSYRKRKAA